MNNLMVDLEGLGTKSNSVITQIGAVQFDIETGELGKQFKANISIDSCLKVGLKVDQGAIEFWLNQSDGARLGMIKNSKPLGEVLYEFQAFIQTLKPSELYLWGNSARFDLGLLENAYTACNKQTPWLFRNERDVRTIVGRHPEIKKRYVDRGSVGILHDAIDDCIFQIEYLVATHNYIERNR